MWKTTPEREPDEVFDASEWGRRWLYWALRDSDLSPISGKPMLTAGLDHNFEAQSLTYHGYGSSPLGARADKGHWATHMSCRVPDLTAALLKAEDARKDIMNLWATKVGVKDDPRSVRIDGQHYWIQEPTQASREMRGFGGKRFRIQFTDGRTDRAEVITDNLWFGGEIPPKAIEYGLTDNAVFGVSPDRPMIFDPKRTY